MVFSGKLYIITGSAGGLGRAFAEKLLQRGALVCISDIKEALGLSALEELSREYGSERVMFQQCDVTMETSVRALWDAAELHFKTKVYCIVNNAGVMGEKEGWKLCMDINLTGVMHGATLAMEKMGKSGGGEGGVVVNVASILGLFCATQPKGFQYNVSKSAVVTLSRCMGNKDYFARDGVRVLCLCPSVAQTPILEGCTETEIKEMKKDVGGIMTPDHVANAFMSLVSEGRSGDVMAVWINSPPYYIPDTGMFLFIVYTTCAMILSWVPGVRTVRPWMMVLTVMGIVFSWYLGAQFMQYIYSTLL